MSTQRPVTPRQRYEELSEDLIVAPFPTPEGRLVGAYWKLEIAAKGPTPELVAGLGDLDDLPRPWVPSSLRDPTMRQDLWKWLGNVVVWLNQEYTWDTVAMIPQCWSHHPHIINDLAVLADQRRAAERSYTSNAMETWERETLPGFIARMQSRLKQQCTSGQHKPWPGNPRHRTYLADEATHHRDERLTRDVTATGGIAQLSTSGRSFQLSITRSLDMQTGEYRHL